MEKNSTVVQQSAHSLLEKQHLSKCLEQGCQTKGLGVRIGLAETLVWPI